MILTPVTRYAATATLLIATSHAAPAIAQSESAGVEHRVLATSKTSTMEHELNAAAEAGFRFQSVMGGESAFGGKEVVVVMSKTPGRAGRFAYRLLATSRTSTMQKEMQEASEAGYQYRGQTVFSSAFAGEEVVVLLERDKDDPAARFDYRLMATSKTSTLQKELANAGQAGFELVGLTVSKTAMGSKELVAITRRARQ